MNVETTVLNRQRGQRVDAPSLKRFLDRLTGEAPPAAAASFSVCLVSDRRMREYNRAYLGRDVSTDVLSFLGDDEPEDDGRVYLGDILISVASARRQARDAGNSLARELRVLALHGYLHLLGYDHERDGGMMMRLQRRLERRLLPRRAAR